MRRTYLFLHKVIKRYHMFNRIIIYFTVFVTLAVVLSPLEARRRGRPTKRVNTQELFYYDFSVMAGGGKTTQEYEDTVHGHLLGEFEFGVNLFELWSAKDFRHRIGVTATITNSYNKEPGYLGYYNRFYLPFATINNLEYASGIDIPFAAESALAYDMMMNQSMQDSFDQWKTMGYLAAFKTGNISNVLYHQYTADYIEDHLYNEYYTTSGGVGFNYHFLTGETFDPYVGLIFRPFAGRRSLPTTIRTGVKWNFGDYFAVTQVEASSFAFSSNGVTYSGYVGGGYRLKH